MKKIAILTDTASDITLDFCKENNIFLVPFTIYLSEEGIQKEYRDKYDVNATAVYQAMKNGDTPQTATAQLGDIANIYQKIEAEGYTDCIGIIASSGLSSMFQNFVIAKEMYEGNLNIHLFDSKTLTFVEMSFVNKAVSLIHEGKSVADVLQQLAYLRDNSILYFVPETLQYLIRGGRIGTINAMLGNLLNIIPIAYVDKEGKFSGAERKRGFKKAVKRMADLVLENAQVGRDVIYLGAGDGGEMFQWLQDYVKEKAPKIEVIIGEVGAAIAVHAGPGVLGAALVPYYK